MDPSMRSRPLVAALAAILAGLTLAASAVAVAHRGGFVAEHPEQRLPTDLLSREGGASAGSSPPYPVRVG